jgi:hypothetical protein
MYREISDAFIDAIGETGVPEVFVQNARSVVFREKTSRLSRRNKLTLEDSPISFFSFHVPSDYSLKVLSFIADKADLSFPGRGSVLSVPVTVYRKTPPVFDEKKLENLPQSNVMPFKDLRGLVAIVTRGEGNDLAKAILQTGRALPIVTFGTGMGLRDKLGLLRITISAEKEIVQTVVSSHDADANFDRMVDAANLDYPGKGFLFSYPISAAVLDTKMIRGRAFYLASMEQIVSAIDTMKGHSEWRRNSPFAKKVLEMFEKPSAWENLRIISREGVGYEKTRATMNLGAGGATQSRLRLFEPASGTDRTVSHEREINELIINSETREKILAAIEPDEDIFELSSVERISAFRAVKKESRARK